MAKADMMKKPEKWGVDEMLRCLFVMLCTTPDGNFGIRKDILKKVPDHFIHAMGVRDIGHSYLLQIANEVKNGIIVPKGGVWTPSGGR